MTDSTTPPALTPVKRALLKIDALRRELADTRSRIDEPIAIVGIGCRLPGGADSADRLWQLVATGTDAVTEVPADRWSDALHDPRPGRADTFYCRHGAFIDDVDRFDPTFFGLSGREAHRLDPQQRLLLECTWRAMEDARFTAASLQGGRAGVFVGSSLDDYARLSEAAEDAERSYAQTELGTARPFAAGRIAYLFGFHGPAMHIDTACSSSLVTTHLACQSLRERECDVAFSGGANLMLSPEMTIALSELQALSPDGRCATFDAAANGYVRGEGAGVVALMRLSDARAQGRPIRAVIRGSAVNHDGRSNGMTAPNGRAQRDVIRAALARAGVAPDEVDYVEAHGTGTALGDPIELRALHDVYGDGVARTHDLHVGSIKTNIGHLEGAASVAALIKVVGALQHAALPPHLHFRTPTPHLDWSTQRLRVPTALTPWPSNRPGKRIAAISAFGMSGTNAHLVVEAWNDAQDGVGAGLPSAQVATEAPDEPEVLPLSAHSPAALAQALDDLAACATRDPAPALADLAHSLRVGRDPRRLRAVLVATRRDELATAARARAAAVRASVAAPSAPGATRLAFLFTGQGSQYAGMTRRLYQACPVFRRTIDECDAAFEAETGESLLDVMYGDDGDESGSPSRIDETRYTQPALFAIELGLARLWSHWGLRPDALIGHSVGEYAAACFAGVFDVADGLRLVAARGRLMQAMTPPGRMSAVLACAEQVLPYVTPYADRLSLAADNAPASVVIAGDPAAHDEVVSALAQAGIAARPIAVSCAFHSPLMAPMLAAFRDVARRIAFRAPTLPIVSNVSAAVESQRLCDPEYWVEHVRATVRFREGLQALLHDGAATLLELGPGATLTGLAKACAGAPAVRCLASLGRQRDDRRAILEALAALAEAGHDVDWPAVGSSFDTAHPPRLVALPPYPFDRGTYWVGTRRVATQARPLAVAGTRARAHETPLASLGLLGHELHSPGLADRRFERPLTLDALPTLRGHAFRERVVFPAAGFATIALEAVRRLAPTGPVALADLSIDTPLLLDDAQPAMLATVVAASGGQSRIDIHAGTGSPPQWTRHASATLIAPADIDAAITDDAGAALEPVDIDTFYARLHAAGLRYAGAFRALRELKRGDSCAVGRIALDAADSATPWPVVHPAVFDNALQVVAAALSSEAVDAVHLPVGIDRLDLFDPVVATRALTARARILARQPLVCADIDLVDDSGRLAARLRGVKLAAVDARQLELPTVFALHWERLDATAPIRGDVSRALLVGADNGPLDDALRAAIGHGGTTVATLNMPFDTADTTAATVRRRVWTGRLAAALDAPASSRPEVVVYAWPQAIEDTSAADEPLAVAAAHARFADFWDALNSLSLDGPPPRVAVVTRRSQSLPGEDCDAPSQAAAWGLVRSLMHEGDGAQLGLVDIDRAGATSAAAAWRAIASLPGGDDRQFVVRDDVVHVPRLVRRRMPAAAAQTPTGAWLVTGGRGAIGTRLVERLVAQCAPKIVSASRTLPAAAERERLVRLAQAAGSTLEFAAVDLADARAVQALVDRLAADLQHPLTGVFHAAGVLEDGLLRGQPDATVRRVLAPKVAGTLNLHRATSHLPLAQFLCFSSIVATIGAPGQCAYGAANAVVEALVTQRRARGLAAQAIGWGLWAGDGMADKLDAVQRHRLEASGIQALDPDEALRAMDSLAADTATSASTCVVARLDATVLHARSTSPGLRALLSQVVTPARPAADVGHAAPDDAAGALAALVRATPATEREAVLVARLGARLAAALQVPAGQIGATTPLIEVGLDSLAAAEFRATLRRELDVDIPFGRLLEGATLRDIVRAIDERLGRDDAAHAPAARPPHHDTASRAGPPPRLAAVSAEASFGADMEAGEL